MKRDDSQLKLRVKNDMTLKIPKPINFDKN